MPLNKCISVPVIVRLLMIWDYACLQIMSDVQILFFSKAKSIKAKKFEKNPISKKSLFTISYDLLTNAMKPVRYFCLVISHVL